MNNKIILTSLVFLLGIILVTSQAVLTNDRDITMSKERLDVLKEKGLDVIPYIDYTKGNLTRRYLYKYYEDKLTFEEYSPWYNNSEALDSWEDNYTIFVADNLIRVKNKPNITITQTGTTTITEEKK